MNSKLSILAILALSLIATKTWSDDVWNPGEDPGDDPTEPNPTLPVEREPPSHFSRANCFNNESINYNYWDLGQWRLVVSYHKDTWTTDNHFVASGPFSHYDAEDRPVYQLVYTDRAGAVHVGEGISVGQFTFPLVPAERWNVNGEHTTFIGGKFYYTYTFANGCDFDLSQFT